MGVVDRQVGVPAQNSGLSPQVLNVGDMYVFGFPLASATNNVLTTNSLATSFNNTLGVGTQVDIARMLHYRMSITGGSASSAGISGGTIVINGSDIFGIACSETIPLSGASGLAANSTAVTGSVAFGSIASNGISVSGFLLHTSYSANSNSITVAIGMANVLGVPGDVRGGNLTQNLTGTATVAFSGTSTPFPYMWNGTSRFTNYTVNSGNVPFAGINVGPTLGSGTMLYGMHMWSR